MSEAIAEFARREVAPRRLWVAEAFPLDIWQAMGAAGLFRIGLPAEYGGDGGGYTAIAAADAALVEFGGAPGFGGAWAVHQMVARFMVDGFATGDQKAALLPGLAAGTSTIGVAISEPDVGAHPKHLTTTARRTADGWVIDGTKSYASNGPIANFFLVFAITEQTESRKRFSAFLIPRDTAGIETIAAPALAFLRPSQHCGLKITGCVVPDIARLGAEGSAYEAMAMPFRDIEDAVGASGMAAALTNLVRNLARATDPDRTEAASVPLGGLAATAAIARDAARSLAEGLDAGAWRPGAPPATLTGLRLLAAELLARMQLYRADFAPSPDDAIDAVMGDVSIVLGIARGPKIIKQGRLGLALLREK